MRTTAIVMFIIALASVFGWLLAYERVPDQIVGFILSISDSKITFSGGCRDVDASYIRSVGYSVASQIDLWVRGRLGELKIDDCTSTVGRVALFNRMGAGICHFPDSPLQVSLNYNDEAL